MKIKQIIKKMISIVKVMVLKIRFRKNISISWNQNISSKVYMNISGDSKIDIEKMTCNDSGYFAAVNGGNISIGKDVFFNRNCMLISRKRIVIEDKCLFGPNVIIYDHDHKFDGSMIYADQYKTDEVVIEEGCWIGANVTILKGTRIGRGSVIGAGSVIYGVIPAHSLVTSSREMNIKKLNA